MQDENTFDLKDTGIASLRLKFILYIAYHPNCAFRIRGCHVNNKKTRDEYGLKECKEGIQSRNIQIQKYTKNIGL